jgi:hypothetical protein
MAAPKGNKYAIGNKGGRPAFFNSPEELQAKIDDYFKNPPDVKEIAYEGGIIKLHLFSICGLAYFLGFESRQSFYAYEAKEEFNYIIKRARLKIEMHYEQNLAFNNATGSIFALKNMGWMDRTDITSGGEKITDVKVTYIDKINGDPSQ